MRFLHLVEARRSAQACYISLRMGLLFFFFHWWSLLLQGVAIVHFIRRRPDTYWIFVILFLGWIGAAVYIVAEDTWYILPVREVRLSAGAGFVVAICGDIMTMPGLPRVPAAESIYLREDGEIEGLF